MEEKRISLRFRMDNHLDKAAWDALEELTGKRNLSKNALALELILKGARQTDEAGEKVEQLADRIAEKILQQMRTVHFAEAGKETADSMVNSVPCLSEDAFQADEPVPLGENALDFLSAF